MNFKLKTLTPAIVFLGLLFAGCSNDNISPQTNVSDNPARSILDRKTTSKLETIKSRGTLICGVSGKLPGFSFIDRQGRFAGLDVDFCRAVAAALFDNPDRVQFRQLSSQERFNALKTGEVDLLARNTTWTISRDGDVGVSFAPTLFYDGQAIMSKLGSRIRRLEDLESKTICVKTGTTSLLNLSDNLRQRGINHQTLAISDEDQLYNAYLQGRCQAITSDRTQLIGRRSKFNSPENHYILRDVLSKEPLAPAVADGDTEWFDVVRWTAFALIQAEEFGISSKNIYSFSNSKDPAIARFLGDQGSLGQNMGLSNDFAARIVKHVGNYGEVYNRNIGEPFNLDRNQNQLWLDGGLLYSPPFR